MEYRPRWERIIFLAVILNFFVMFAFASNWDFPDVPNKTDNLQEISWVDSAVEEIPAQSQIEVQTFPEIILPPLEIPKFEPIPPPEPVKVEKPVESPKEIPPTEEPKPAENEKTAEPQSPADNLANQLKAIVKVYPKDLIDQLVVSGAVKEKISLNDEKIIVAVTIGTDGKIKNAEIISGGGNNERGKIINLVSQIAASSWIFEPYLDENGNPKELKTQIEFKSEDF